MPGSSQVPRRVAHGKGKTRIVADNERALSCGKDKRLSAGDDIEENSLFKHNLVEDHKFRKSYCSFLRDAGSKLRMPFVVVATSTVFCHRFFNHQPHEKNDQYIIATACIFLAGKVEESRRGLEDVVFVSYCLQNKNNPLAAEEFKKKEVCERQKERVILAEQMVLVNLDFNLEVEHPHSYILTATPKYKPDSEMLTCVASIILNDVLYTTLCLHFKPRQIAASALFLAAKLVKHKFPSKDWWRDFGVKMQELEDICNQILELYEQERTPFSVVHLSSPSSPIDAKAKGVPAHVPSIPRELKCEPQSNSLAASKNKSRLIKCSFSRSQSAVLRPPSTCPPPATELKSGLKELF